MKKTILGRKKVGDGLKPQERIYLQGKIIAHFKKSPQSIPLSEIATKIGTSYECVRRICTEMFEVELLKRTKVITGQKGRPSYLYGHK